MFLVRGGRLLVEAVDAGRSLIGIAEPGDVLIWMESAVDQEGYELARDRSEPPEPRTGDTLEERGRRPAG
jgi:hypothetical protein